MIKRNKYLDELIRSKNNGFPKVITGIRRCGKSFLLKEIFVDYLKNNGVKEENIIIIEFDDILNYSYRNPKLLSKDMATEFRKLPARNPKRFSFG